MTSDEELAERTRAGDTRAFGVLWSRHAKAGLAAARQFRTIADADDIVAEAYLQILRAMQRGGGPREAFRPYLYRTIRNVALGWIPKTRTVDIDDVQETLPSEEPDLETSALEKTITVRAFRTLPERWQTILWYTEVEGMDPAEAAPYLGLTPNASAALAYRAREGLKKAWLQAHVNDQRVPAECRWTTERMGDYNRRALSPRARARFEKHLETCTRCSIIVEEIDDVAGRLAAMLFPLVLGGAGAALLAGKLAASNTGSHDSAAATAADGKGQASSNVRAVGFAHRPVRIAVTASAAIVLTAAVATGALAAAGALHLEQHSARSSAQGKQPSSPAPAAPNASRALPTPAPSTPATPPSAVSPPAAPTVSAPVAPTPVTLAALLPPPVPPVPPDLVAPAAPTVTAPVDGALIATQHPQLVGTGEPGAVVTVERYDTQGNDLGPVASTTVNASGAWTAVPTVPIPDGTWQLRVTQTDAAGNRSGSTIRTITIDTTALPPTLDATPPNPLEYLPTISGTAEPGATVTLHDDHGTVIGTATADLTGRWSIPLPDPQRDGATLTATQQDRAGNISQPSTPTVPLTFQRPTILSPVDGNSIPPTPGGTAVTVQISGTPGQQVQILIDGKWTGNTHTLGIAPTTRITPQLADGAHTIGVRYYNPVTGQLGSTSTITFTIE